MKVKRCRSHAVKINDLEKMFVYEDRDKDNENVYEGLVCVERDQE